MLINVLELTTDKNKVRGLAYYSKLLYISLRIWRFPYQLWQAVWSAGRSWADPAGLNDGTVAWSWELCSGSSAASLGSPAARTRCTGWTTCPEPGRHNKSERWGRWYSIFVSVNVTHEKNRTNSVLVHVLILTDFPSLSVAFTIPTPTPNYPFNFFFLKTK